MIKIMTKERVTIKTRYSYLSHILYLINLTKKKMVCVIDYRLTHFNKRNKKYSM